MSMHHSQQQQQQQQQHHHMYNYNHVLGSNPYNSMTGGSGVVDQLMLALDPGTAAGLDWSNLLLRSALMDNPTTGLGIRNHTPITTNNAANSNSNNSNQNVMMMMMMDLCSPTAFGNSNYNASNTNASAPNNTPAMAQQVSHCGQHFLEDPVVDDDVCHLSAKYHQNVHGEQAGIIPAAAPIQWQQFLQPSTNGGFGMKSGCLTAASSGAEGMASKGNHRGPYAHSSAGKQDYCSGTYSSCSSSGSGNGGSRRSSSSSSSSNGNRNSAGAYIQRSADGEEEKYDDMRRLMMQQEVQAAAQQQHYRINPNPTPLPPPPPPPPPAAAAAAHNQYHNHPQQQQTLQLLQQQHPPQLHHQQQQHHHHQQQQHQEQLLKLKSFGSTPLGAAAICGRQGGANFAGTEEVSSLFMLQLPYNPNHMAAGLTPDPVILDSSYSTAAPVASMDITTSPTSHLYTNYSPISCSSTSNNTSCCYSTTTDTSINVPAAVVKEVTLTPPNSSSSSPSCDQMVSGGSHGTAANNASPWMDPRVWSRMPGKLVELVLACLPLPSFFRSRLVCKTWYNLMFSDSFLELCARRRHSHRPAGCSSSNSSSPWFLLFRRGVWSEAFMFDPEGRAWFRLDLSFIPSSFRVVASAAGLLCCISDVRGCKTVLICNPLTRSCLQLPSTLKERFVPTVGLVVDEGDGDDGDLNRAKYRVVMAGDDLISPFAVKNLTTEVYDSRRQRWRMAAPLPRLCNLESGKTTYANGFFYCMNYSPFSVLSYDGRSTDRGEWTKIEAPMRRFLRTPNLVECRGRLVLVAAVEKNKLNVPKSIRIWGLQPSRTSWVELERMPQALYDDFMMVSQKKAFHCTGHGNLILITLHDSPDMIIYDFYEKVWRWAPRCPFTSSDHGGASGFNSGCNEISSTSATSSSGAMSPISSSRPSATSSNYVPEMPAGFQAFAFEPRLEASVC